MQVQCSQTNVYLQCIAINDFYVVAPLVCIPPSGTGCKNLIYSGPTLIWEDKALTVTQCSSRGFMQRSLLFVENWSCKILDGLGCALFLGLPQMFAKTYLTAECWYLDTSAGRDVSGRLLRARQNTPQTEGSPRHFDASVCEGFFDWVAGAHIILYHSPQWPSGGLHSKRCPPSRQPVPTGPSCTPLRPLCFCVGWFMSRSCTPQIHFDV